MIPAGDEVMDPEGGIDDRKQIGSTTCKIDPFPLHTLL